MLDIKLKSILQRPKPQNLRTAWGGSRNLSKHVRENVIKSGGKAQIYITADVVLGKKQRTILENWRHNCVPPHSLLFSSFDSLGKHSVCLSSFVQIFSIFTQLKVCVNFVKVVHLISLPGEGKITYVACFTEVGFFASPSSWEVYSPST